MKRLTRDRVFYLLCLTMPFLFIPKALHLSFIGGPISTMLMVHVILLAYAYSFYCYKKDNNFLYKKDIFIKFTIIYIFVLIISLMHGLFIYPYYDLIFSGPINQIEKLPRLINFLNECNVMINEKILLSAWMIVRFFKGVILEIIYTFGFSYILYCWYKDEPQVAIKIIKKSIYIISIIIVLFGFVELFFLFGYEWAKKFLITVTPFLHGIKVNFDWWPPLLWYGRMRNIFPEPSQFGMYTAFIMPFLWAEILNGNKKLLSLVLIFIISFFVFLTQAKTAVLLFLGEMFLLNIYVLYKRNIWKKYLQILTIVIISFVLSLWCVNNYNNKPLDVLFQNKFIKTTDVKDIRTEKNIKKEQNIKIPTQKNADNIKKEVTKVDINENVKNKNITKDNNTIMEKYIDQNITGVVDSNSGSNNARFAIMKSDIRIWQDHILLGVGNGLKSAYTEEYLNDDEKKNGEIKLWGNLQSKYGVLKSGYPSINEFSKRLAENGILGFVCYIFPLLFLIYKFYKNRKNYNLDFEENNDVICMLIALIGCFVTGMSGMLTTIQTYWLLLGIAYAYLLTIKNTKCKSVDEK